MSRQVGIIGLGNLGAALVERLRGDAQILAVDPDESARASWLGTSGLTLVSDVADADWSEVERVHVLVRTHQQAATVLNELERTDGDDLPVHVHTTLIPREVAALIGHRRRRVRALEQPITGGAAGFRAGTVTVLNAGPVTQEDRDWISRAASRVVDFDELGQPTLAKLINNAVAAATTRATLDLLAAAVDLGLPLGLMRTVLRHGSGASQMAEELESIGDDQAGLLVKDVRLLQGQVGALPSLRLDDEAAMLTGLTAFKAAIADPEVRP